MTEEKQNDSMPNNDPFAWDGFYMEFADKLAEENKNAPDKFLERLIGAFYPKDDNGRVKNDLPVENLPVDKAFRYNCTGSDEVKQREFIKAIDPFSIFLLFNHLSVTDDNRRGILNKLKEEFGVKKDMPQNVAGIPFITPQMPLFFDVKSTWNKTINGYVDRLWNLFYAARTYANAVGSPNENECEKARDGFEGVLNEAIEKVQGCALCSLTQGLFWINPHVFLTCDKLSWRFLTKIVRPLLDPNVDSEKALLDATMYEPGSADDYIKLRNAVYAARGKVNEIVNRFLDSMGMQVSEKYRTEDTHLFMRLSFAAYHYIKGTLQEAQRLLQSHQQLILSGAPGTGKTYSAFILAACLIGEFKTIEEVRDEHVLVLQKRKQPEEVAKILRDEDSARLQKLRDNFAFVQFHPGYDYTDFVEGLKPESDGNGIVFKRRLGIFGELCRKACEKPDEKFVILIDEINRADLSRVLGELFVGLEKDYRGIPIDTQYSTMPLDGKTYKIMIPPNVYIIGTMNDIDRSVESMDFALRRRFAWLEVAAEDSEIILNSIGDGDVRKELLRKMREINKVISGERPLNAKGVPDRLGEFLGRDYQLGGAYFAKYREYARIGEKPKEAYESLWENHIQVILTEYLRSIDRCDRVKILEELKKIYDNSKKEAAKGNKAAKADDAVQKDS